MHYIHRIYTHEPTVCVLAGRIRRRCGTHAAGGSARCSEVRRGEAESARRAQRTCEELRQGTQIPRTFLKI